MRLPPTNMAGRNSLLLFILEAAIAISIVLADRRHLVPLSNTPFLLILGWISLRLRGLRWRNVGFLRPQSWTRALTIGIAAGVAMELFAIYVSEPLIARLTGSYPDLSDMRGITGNVSMLVLFLALNWTLAAFGEELVYRGYLLCRLSGLLPASSAVTISLILVSIFFGFAHGESQGLPGMMQEGFAGLLLGLLYLGTGKTLAVPIIAHGVSNTLAFVLMYFGRYPGL
jgi:membrane protease YdiL (CAAX protease family)